MVSHLIINFERPISNAFGGCFHRVPSGAQGVVANQGIVDGLADAELPD